MPTVIAQHDVKDVEHWLSSPKREELFSPLGVTNIRTFVNPQNDKQVSVSFDVPDLEAFTASLETPDAAAAMEYDGVLPETLVMYIER